MSTENKGKNLNKAKKEKNNEFYTQLVDIENELRHYKEHFRDKVVFCNCDDGYDSNFFKYFALNFNILGLKRLIAVSYAKSGRQVNAEFVTDSEKGYVIELDSVTDINGDGAIDLEDVTMMLKQKPPRMLDGDGDFRSDECVTFLKQSDIVVSNPPFSLFREYIAQLMEFGKKFIILGNQNALTYKDVFTLIKNNSVWLGCGDCVRWFMTTEDTDMKYKLNNYGQKIVEGARSRWFTNLSHSKRNEKLIMYRTYTENDYPKYDNYAAINVDKVTEIPKDYEGVMGVPITFLDKYNPTQFEILGLTENGGKGLSNGLLLCNSKATHPLLQGKKLYARVLVRNKQPEKLEMCLLEQNKPEPIPTIKVQVPVVKTTQPVVEQPKGKVRKQESNDDIYTQLSDIELELNQYKKQFKDKIVLCNCGDTSESNFFKFFAMNFKRLGLKKLIAVSYEKDVDKKASVIELDGVDDMNGDGAVGLDDVKLMLDKVPPRELKGNGDFRSEECIAFLKKADIVVTNPPASLFKEFVAQLVDYDKQFLVMGAINAILCKELFKLFKSNRLRLGITIRSGSREFRVPDTYSVQATGVRVDEKGIKWKSVKGVRWFTNMIADNVQPNDDLVLYKTYNKEEYPKYDNFDAINVDKASDIPRDYFGVMGVPVTFFDSYNTEQFRILGISSDEKGLRTKVYTAEDTPKYKEYNKGCVLKTETGYQPVYTRIFICRKGL